MLIFHSYVSLPEGKESCNPCVGKTHGKPNPAPALSMSMLPYMQAWVSIPCQLEIRQQIRVFCKSALSASATETVGLDPRFMAWLWDTKTIWVWKSGTHNHNCPHHHPVAIVKNPWDPRQCELDPSPGSWSSRPTLVIPSHHGRMTWIVFWGTPILRKLPSGCKLPWFFVESMTIPFHIMKGIYTKGVNNIYIHTYNLRCHVAHQTPGRSIEAGIGVGVGLSEAAKISPV